jgi:large subunit ribosomal protein L1
MAKLTKKQKEAASKIEKNKLYSLKDASSLLKVVASAKFDESVDIAVRLGVDPRKANQMVRGVVTLPHGTGKDTKVLALVTPDKEAEAKAAGANTVGNDDLIEKITQGNLDFDLLIATPNMMPKLAKLGRLLGPKGLMPSPKSGTVSNTLTQTLTEFKKGKFEYKADKTGVVHVNFGKADFTDEQLLENLKELYKSIEQNRPSGVRGKYFKSLFICTSMGPSIKLDLDSFL